MFRDPPGAPVFQTLILGARPWTAAALWAASLTNRPLSMPRYNLASSALPPAPALQDRAHARRLRLRHLLHTCARGSRPHAAAALASGGNRSGFRCKHMVDRTRDEAPRQLSQGLAAHPGLGKDGGVVQLRGAQHLRALHRLLRRQCHLQPHLPAQSTPFSPGQQTAFEGSCNPARHVKAFAFWSTTQQPTTPASALKRCLI